MLIVKNGKKKRKRQTFENERLAHVPDIVKSPRSLADVEKYSAWGIREDVEDWLGMVGMPIFVGRFRFEFGQVRIRRRGETIVKVRALRESQTPIGRIPVEVPKNFLQLRIVIERLCYGNQIPGKESAIPCSRRTIIG
jgi:hypothetical protein